ncbi:MAG: glycosyltransferase [Desulfovibrionales bacterium]
MTEHVLRADIHVHSRHSSRPSQWVLQKIGCPESFTEPREIYRLARLRGMDLVTVTDHNSLAGSLEIAELEATFLSEEITTYFPEDGCKMHVLALGISEAHHEEISRLRENVYDLAAYLHAQSIVCVAAHPLYSVNGKLTLEHFERMLLLFRNFELNGARDDVLNALLTRIMAGLTRGDLEFLADKHRREPFGERPWRKNLTGGSDDHSSLNIARAYTEVQGAGSVLEFLQGIEEGKGSARVRPSTPKTMAHNLYAIAYQFYRHKFSLERFVRKDQLLRFIDTILTAPPEQAVRDGVLVRLQGFLSSKRIFSGPARNTSVENLLLKEGRNILSNDPSFRKVVEGRAHGSVSEEAWSSLIAQVTDRVLSHCVGAVLNDLNRASLFGIFHTLGATGSLYTLLAPYFVAFSEFTADRQFGRNCLAHFRKGKGSLPTRLKVAHFTDTFDEVNGVARDLRMEVRIAAEMGKQLTVLSCCKGEDSEQLKHFEAIGTFSLPEYPGLTLSYPPFLRILEYCFAREFTTIHVATPGPMGLCGLAVARILNLPVHGTYHTAFPEYVGELTGDGTMQEIMRRYMVWFYNMMDAVYAPSRSTKEDLVTMGVDSGRIRIYPRGIDVERFNPAKRNGFFAGRFGLKEPGLKLLYVGRISREKGLEVLLEAMERLVHMSKNVHLIMVGDGPALLELKAQSAGLPVTFTGFLDGEDLAQAYASSDVFVFPSTTDHFGNVVLEAQASGLPVVVTGTGGPPENLLPEESGFVVDGGTAEGFATCVARLADDPELLARMGENARNYMLGRSFEATFRETWELFRRDSEPKQCSPTVRS